MEVYQIQTVKADDQVIQMKHSSALYIPFTVTQADVTEVPEGQSAQSTERSLHNAPCGISG